MFVILFVRFMRGFVRLRISGNFSERLINLCSARGISVWNICRSGDSIECNIFAADYRRIRPLRRACRVRVRIKYRRGFPFAVGKYRRRYGLMVGAAAMVVLLTALPRFAWCISVSGNSSVPSSAVLAALGEVGVSVGVPLSRIDCDNMRQLLLLDMPELSWAAINIEGATVTVEVREALAPDVVDDDDYCNVAADFDGRIVKMQVWGGQPIVSVGDAVRAGDVLVLGTREYANGYTEFSHASAVVIAETERTLSVEVPYNQKVRRLTDKRVQKQVLRFFWLDIPLYLGSEQYDYEATADYTPLTFEGVALPIGIASAEFTATEQVDVTYLQSEAESLGRRLLDEQQRDKLGDAEVLSREITVEHMGDKAVITAKYLCREDIAVTVPLEIEQN